MLFFDKLVKYRNRLPVTKDCALTQNEARETKNNK